MFFTYRRRSRYLTKVWDQELGEWKDLRAGLWPVDQIHDDVLDRIYVTTFLKQPAELAVMLGGEAQIGLFFISFGCVLTICTFNQGASRRVWRASM